MLHAFPSALVIAVSLPVATLPPAEPAATVAGPAAVRLFETAMAERHARPWTTPLACSRVAMRMIC